MDCGGSIWRAGFAGRAWTGASKTDAETGSAVSESNRFNTWSMFGAAVVSCIFTILSLAMIGFEFVIVALAYYNGDVPEHLELRWKY